MGSFASTGSSLSRLLADEEEKAVVRLPMIGDTQLPELVCLITGRIGLSSTALAAMSEAVLEPEVCCKLAATAAEPWPESLSMSMLDCTPMGSVAVLLTLDRCSPWVLSEGGLSGCRC